MPAQPSDGQKISPDELAGALARRELSLVYQLQYGVAERRYVAVEALLRWRHPQHGQVSPASFIALAEAHGLMQAVTDFVLWRACRDAAAWPSLDVAVNVSPVEFGGHGILARVKDALAQAAFPAERLVIEIIESSGFADPAAAGAELRELQACGIRIALDDFGTGHSSLLLQQGQSFDIVKIDKALVDAIETPRAQRIVRSIVELVHGLAMKVTAEGVETQDQQRILAQIGCDQLQGFFFARPVEASGVAALIAAAPPPA